MGGRSRWRGLSRRLGVSEARALASQRVRPKVAGPMTSSAKQSSPIRGLDCLVALLVAMTLSQGGEFYAGYQRRRLPHSCRARRAGACTRAHAVELARHQSAYVG